MILIIGNPSSGGKKARHIFDLLIKYASMEQLNFNSYLTCKTKDYEGILEAYNTTQPDLVISCGGDGTANDVINALHEHLNDTAFLILPAGSGNDFSRQVYGKLPPEKLFYLAKSKKFRYADLGLCNDAWFLNGIGIGFDGSVARETHTNAKRLLPTTLKYYLAIFKNVLFYKEFRFRTEREGPIKKAFMLAVANGNCYGGGFMIAPGAVPDDGLLDVVEIGEIKPWRRPMQIPVVQRGKHLKLSFVKHYQTTSIDVYSADGNPIPAHADGEIFESDHFNIKLMRQALRIPDDSL